MTRVIKKKILQKPFVRGGDVVEFNEMLHGIIDTIVDKEILSSPIPQHEEIATLSIIHILKILKGTPSDDTSDDLFGSINRERITKVFQNLLLNFLRKKNTRVSEKFFIQFMTRQPDLAVEFFVSSIIKAAKSKHKLNSEKTKQKRN